MTCPHFTEEYAHCPPTGTVIYQEECVRCFISTDSSSGIDLCLCCFESGCTKNDLSHNVSHFDLTKHPIYLNIRRTPKDQEEPPQKLTKLEIKEENEADKFQFYYNAHCIVCDVAIDQENEKVKAIVDALKKSPSASQMSQVKSWENEIVPCEHVLTLQQTPAYTVSVNGSCTQCELSENLWLCLNCGKLSCGRKQFGGGGGNGHAVEHFQSTNHGVAVKLHSLSASSQPDVYCYICDEERDDPEIKNHLSTFGLNLDSMSKTEKSLAEMQLAQNLNFDFGSMEEEEGAKKLFGPCLTGLRNLGNSCYLSSVVQALFSIDVFRNHYLQVFQTHNAKCSSATTCLVCQLGKLADGLCSGKFSRPSHFVMASEDPSKIPFQDGLRPFMLKDIVGKGHEEFSTGRQQDAYEFLLYLLKKVKTAKDESGLDMSSMVSFTTEQRLQCLGCNRARYSKIETESLALPIVKRNNGESFFEDCLRSFVSQDQMEYTCESCHSKAGAVTQTRFVSFPKVLAVQLNRFDIVNWELKKVNTAVQLGGDAIYDLSDFLVGPRQEGEELLPEESKSQVEWNELAMEQLTAMGFSVNRCQHALLATGNSDAESAMNWLFEHLEDPSIDEPVDLSKISEPSSTEVSSDHVSSLCDMGFTVKAAKHALKETQNNVERAVDWLFSHTDDLAAIENATEGATDQNSINVFASTTVPALYKLKAIVCHKGGSVHAGHYVAFIRELVDGQDVWALFNDEKVLQVSSLKETESTSYVYILERLDA
ncbi:ubiquitin carboxy terminal hydrolase Ubp14 [Schizosaccharomyces japonicus yFS275]|uniref:Ubiquitin carboxyl-terminal hydrolase n=1 Tax=Schizosaccharomyces japonicus (strain yFS275 / FY16936) TaxID=402676 RepID=B6JW74_SCHJY|nr:ubiquitin carboxy terminal hydrolase Ubp14 [Schizosaccharomyces japonicus yFS275]EEB05625.1 ubiquitin carboxy terminal hydrolase Ubp14 [Schizosaccharomyces japonicus yFS275]